MKKKNIFVHVRAKAKAPLQGQEILYGFCAWLTGRKQSITIGATEDCSPVVELIKIWSTCNKILPEPRFNWSRVLKQPKEDIVATQVKCYRWAYVDRDNPGVRGVTDHMTEEEFKRTHMNTSQNIQAWPIDGRVS